MVDRWRATFEGWKIPAEPDKGLNGKTLNKMKSVKGPFVIDIFEEGKSKFFARLVPTMQEFRKAQWRSLADAQSAVGFAFERCIENWKAVE